MTFLLKGFCDHFGNHGNEFRIERAIEAEDVRSAVEQAQVHLRKEKEKHGYDTIGATLFQPIWTSKFVPAQPAVPVQAASPAMEAHFSEQLIGGKISA
jgi:hypothetical protein